MNTWLVTGASGFLGANLGCWLQGKAQRIGLGRGPAALGLYDEYVSLDLATDLGSLPGVISRIRPDVVVNAAAFADHKGCEEDPDAADRVNHVAARAVAHAAASCGARLIHISTDAVFDGSRGAYAESDEPSPFSVYGESKLLGELAVLEEYPSAVVARTNFFGWSPAGTRSILEFFVNNLEEGSRVKGFTDFVVTSAYAQDLVDVLYRIAGTSHSGVLHATTQDSLSKYDFGVQVAQTFGLDPELIDATVGSLGPDGISRTRDLSLNTALLQRLIGDHVPLQARGVQAAYADLAVRSAIRNR